MGREWEKSVVCACGHGCCEEQGNVGTFCWIWAPVRQQQLSCPAQSWECAVVTVQALGLGTEEAPAGCPEVPWGFRNGGAGKASLSFTWSPPVAAGGFHRKKWACGSESMLPFSGAQMQTTHEMQSTGCVLPGHLKLCDSDQLLSQACAPFLA